MVEFPFRFIFNQFYPLKFLVMSTNLLLGHVQEPNSVAFAIEVCPYGVQGFVELSLDVFQLFKHLAG